MSVGILALCEFESRLQTFFIIVKLVSYDKQYNIQRIFINMHRDIAVYQMSCFSLLNFIFKASLVFAACLLL